MILFTDAHDSLTGLTTGDDHTQYLFLAGRTGNQSATGSIDSGGTLTLLSTSHGTKGKIIFGNAGTTVYDEVNERIGIGLAAPLETLHLFSSGATKVFIETTTLDTNTALGFKGPSSEWQIGSNRVGLAGSNDNLYIRHSNTSTNVMVVEPSGNIGIGLNDPTEMLHVQGNIRCTGTISLFGNFFLDGGSNTYLTEVSADKIGLYTAGVSRMTISTTLFETTVDINVVAGKVYKQSGNSGIGANGTTYTFGGGVDGDIATLTVAGGIVTGKTDASDPTPSTLQGFHGEFVIQHSSGGNIDFRANGAGTNVNEKTLFSGGIINTIGDVEEGYYTIGDIVKALKENGTLEAFGGDTWQPT